MGSGFRGKLNIVLDIDNTLIEFMKVKDCPWPELSKEERMKYAVATNEYYETVDPKTKVNETNILVSGFLFRPQLWDFFAWMKKLAKSVNLWTLSDKEYADGLKTIIEKKMGKGFIANVWCDRDNVQAEKFNVPKESVRKNLNWIWKKAGGTWTYAGDVEDESEQLADTENWTYADGPGMFSPCDTVLIDDYETSIRNVANARNGIQIRKFALWSRVTKKDPFGPYRDMSQDRALLDVVDELKKIDQETMCVGEDSRPIENPVLRVSVPGGRKKRLSTRRSGRRRSSTRRRSGARR